MAKSSNILLKEKLISDIKANGQVPNHVAIIMDGNGRWAKKRNLPRVAGHKKGVETVREIVKTCVEVGVNYLTIYTFSTENWKRPKDEVSTLMRLIVKSLQNETDELHSNGVKLTATGDINSLPFIVQKELRDAFIKTQDNSKLVLNLALSYSGRWEIVEAVKKIAGKISNKELLPDYLIWARDNGYSFNVLIWKKPNAIPIGDSHRPDIEYLLLFRKSAIWNKD